MATVYHAIQLPLFPPTKFCTSCQTEKPLEAFVLDSREKFGHTHCCKQCINTRNKKRAQSIVVFSKLCRKCQATKSIEDFHVDTSKRDGHRTLCKDCWNKREREHAKTVKSQRSTYIKNLRKINPMPYIKAQRKYYAGNKQKFAESNSRWMASHPEWVRNRTHIRRARIHRTAFEKVSYKRILERDGMWCHICEKSILPNQKMAFDHVIPVSREGAHVESNIKVSHALCNTRKHDRLLSEMTPYQRRGCEQ